MKKKVAKSCKTCEFGTNGCGIGYVEGYQKGSCGCWIVRKAKL